MSLFATAKTPFTAASALQHQGLTNSSLLGAAIITIAAASASYLK